MINDPYDLDKLVTNAIAKGYKDVKRYNLDDLTVIFTAGDLAAKFWGYDYQLVAIGDLYDNGRITWCTPGTSLGSAVELYNKINILDTICQLP